MELLNQQGLESPDTELARLRGEPLVSIFCFSKNRAASVARCVESVLNQTYRNIEFVIQDGASTDGTLEVLRRYDDPRIKLVSEADSGPAEAFWRALNRCTGDIIGSCASDEELLPHAVESAVSRFKAEPHLGAVTFDGYVTDPEGRRINEFNAGEFSLVDYLFGWYSPLWVASFFRRRALNEIGLKTHDWNLGCLEFEIWCRLGTQHQVKHFPVKIAHYGVNPTQLSNSPRAFNEHYESRAALIRRMFSSDGFFGENELLLKGCLYNQLYLLYNHVRAYGMHEHAASIAARLRHLLDELSLADSLRFQQYFPGQNRAKNRKLGQLRLENFARELWLRLSFRIPASLKRRVPRAVKERVRTAVITALLLPMNLPTVTDYVARFLRRRASLPRPSISPKINSEVAQIYYERGQVDQALQLWRRAEELNDATVDGLACQAMLMCPSATNETLLAAQKRWADRHARPVADPVAHAHRDLSDRRIRVGYFCSFLDSDTVRFQLAPVLRHRNRERFAVYGYSPTVVSDDIASVFDRVKTTGLMSDSGFVQTVRADDIDVLVELSGFSPLNRFSALAARCAPVQVSYLNHTGTSGVPNVDYVLADETCVLPEEDRFFTESVWRLPGSFFCFNYQGAQVPDVAPPPGLSNGFITFGCFGSGGKINQRLIEYWCEIMRRVPNSLLFVRNNQLSKSDNRAHLQNQFWRCGIPAERLRIMKGTDRQGVLQSYSDVDISLDTWPYCGGNTIAEATWQGVPVVTLRGQRFSARYGASLVRASGCPELVADSPAEYIDKAVALAHDPERLSFYRSNLRRMSLEHGFADAKRFAANLETAYEGMLRRAGIRV